MRPAIYDYILDPSIPVDGGPSLNEIADALRVASELAPQLTINLRDGFLKVVDRLAHFPKFFAEVVGVDGNSLAAPSAKERRMGIRFDLPDSYRGFVLALRARNIEVAVEHARKILCLSVGAKPDEDARSWGIK